MSSGGVLWIVYGATKEQWPTALAGLSSTIFGALIVAGILAAHKNSNTQKPRIATNITLPAVLTLTAGTTALLAGPTTSLSHLLTIISLLQYLPQLATTIRSGTLTGLSGGFLLTSFFYGATWLLYGILTKDTPLTVWGALATTIFTATTVVGLHKKVYEDRGRSTNPQTQKTAKNSKIPGR